MDNRDIIVIGGSAGATAPLKTILADLPADLPAAVFVVLHIPSRSLGILASVTAAASRLPVHPATDGLAIRPGNIYLGVADHHLILTEGTIRLGRGPRENMARPAIDALFRSAAAAYGPRVVGLLLSGLLNDGTAGLEAIRRRGGRTVVQHPDDAVASEMPLSALRAVAVDHTLPSIGIGDVLSELVRETAGPRSPVPPELQLEVDIAAGERLDSGLLRHIADPAPFTCPNCGGVLSAMRGSTPLRFRCQVGHALTSDVLAKEQEGAVDEALRVALRIVEERAELVARMAEDAESSGRGAVGELYRQRSDEYRGYAEVIRRAVLLSLPTPLASGNEGGQED